MEKTEVDKKLKELVSKDYIEQELEIKKIAIESGLTKGTLTKQLEKFKTELLKEQDADRNVSIDDLGMKIGQALDKKQLAEHRSFSF